MSVTGSLPCEENRKQVHFSGYKVMDIEPGCVLFARGITFVSAFDPVLHFPTITSRFSPPQSIVDHFANHSSQISEALSSFDFVDYNALVEGGEELERLMRAAPRRRGSEERLRRLRISPASSPEPSNVEEESEEEAIEESMERAHVDIARLPLFPRAVSSAGPILDRRTFKCGKLNYSSDPTFDIQEFSEVF